MVLVDLAVFAEETDLTVVVPRERAVVAERVVATDRVPADPTDLRDPTD